MPNTVAGLKSSWASFEQFALQTENKNAKQLYRKTQAIIDSIEPRD
ncbi:DUF1657 domain-containing protein [Bacillus sp. APMAM]|nr:DUF1657 domain-containing protein [Heyndrickxia shackletonii]MBB2482809.1 DUF1657 domain-containing protein [Bacillus sp. APMAM]NEZ01897.1 DUF1657 domain-containing protein [Heyndrickxia shackletonii]RTZ53762.1 DUF1657 domain-containing protein [Bacillus sp. SAJ1]